MKKCLITVVSIIILTYSLFSLSCAGYFHRDKSGYVDVSKSFSGLRLTAKQVKRLLGVYTHLDNVFIEKYAPYVQQALSKYNTVTISQKEANKQVKIRVFEEALSVTLFDKWWVRKVSVIKLSDL